MEMETNSRQTDPERYQRGGGWIFLSNYF